MVKCLNVVPEPCDASSSRTQMSTQIGFANYTGKTVTVVWRDGRVDQIPSLLSAGRASGNFDVIYSVRATREVLVNGLQQTGVSWRTKKIYNELLKNGKGHGDNYSLCYHVPFEDLDGCRGSYIEGLDLLLTMQSGEDIPSHPYSHSRASTSLLGGLETAALTYRLIIVDKYDVYGERYVNLGGSVKRVPKATDALMPDGVYVAFGSKGDYSVNRYEFDDTDAPLKLYYSKSEAERFGGELDTALAALDKQKRLLADEIDKAKRTTSELETKYAEETSRLELDKQYLTHTLNEKEREVEHLKKNVESKRKIEETETKHHYDEQAVARKNTTEWMKVVPNILGIAGLAIGLYKGS